MNWSEPKYYTDVYQKECSKNKYYTSILDII